MGGRVLRDRRDWHKHVRLLHQMAHRQLGVLCHSWLPFRRCWRQRLLEEAHEGRVTEVEFSASWPSHEPSSMLRKSLLSFAAPFRWLVIPYLLTMHTASLSAPLKIR